VHDSKTTVAHKEFFEIVKRVLPDIASTKTPLVSDQEDGITCNISRVLRDVRHILGWNHVLLPRCEAFRQVELVYDTQFKRVVMQPNAQVQ